MMDKEEKKNENRKKNRKRRERRTIQKPFSFQPETQVRSFFNLPRFQSSKFGNILILIILNEQNPMVQSDLFSKKKNDQIQIKSKIL